MPLCSPKTKTKGAPSPFLSLGSSFITSQLISHASALSDIHNIPIPLKERQFLIHHSPTHIHNHQGSLSTRKLLRSLIATPISYAFVSDTHCRRCKHGFLAGQPAHQRQGQGRRHQSQAPVLRHRNRVPEWQGPISKFFFTRAPGRG